MKYDLASITICGLKCVSFVYTHTHSSKKRNRDARSQIYLDTNKTSFRSDAFCANNKFNQTKFFERVWGLQSTVERIEIAHSPANFSTIHIRIPSKSTVLRLYTFTKLHIAHGTSNKLLSNAWFCMVLLSFSVDDHLKRVSYWFHCSSDSSGYFEREWIDRFDILVRHFQVKWWWILMNFKKLR